MADIVVTSAKVAPCYSDRAEIFNHLAGADLTAGDPVTFNATGAVIKADANDAAANTFRGIALQTVKSGQPVAILYRGHVYGYTITGLNANAPVYVSDTVGVLADAPGTKSLIAGYVTTLSDGTKVLFINGWAS